MNHVVLANTTYKGYSFDRKTFIIPNLSEVHGDPMIFPDPDKFCPDRFLDNEGRFHAHPAMVAFGIGKRECLGKSLAKQEMFLFTSCLLHQVRLGLKWIPYMQL